MKIEDLAPKEWQKRPQVLLLPQIPKPMHGLNPRTILGKEWWDKTRKEAYASTDYHCIACGVYRDQAKKVKWLEGHEVYETQYKLGKLVYIETVPLCHYCHNYIHKGRLEALLKKREITHNKFSAVIQHGDQVISEAGLQPTPPYKGKMPKWADWRLVLLGIEYEPRFSSQKEWSKHYGVGG